MTVIASLEKVLAESTLTFEEQRAFLLGLGYLSEEEQKNFSVLLVESPELIYPLYINYKAKLKAMHEPKSSWDALVEQEIVEFETLLKEKEDNE